MDKNILLIEDDIDISEMVRDYLANDGFNIDTAFNGEEGLIKFLKGSYDLIILDLMMPKIDGIEVLKSIRDKSMIPILIMSAKDTDVDKAIGLGLGADDYISKPFSLLELSARVRAALRRSGSYSTPTSMVTSQSVSNSISYSDISLDLDNFSVTKDGSSIQLTSKEFDILKLFVSSPNRVFTKSQIYSFVWNDDYFGDDNVINVSMRRLREKIEDDPSSPKYIKTLWGIGYRLGE